MSNNNVNRGRFLLTLALSTTLCAGAPCCPETRLQQATIGGAAITGDVILHKRPLKFARVRLYSSSGKMSWRGRTDENGRFVINKVLPDKYRLEVDGWGATTVQLQKDFGTRSNGQVPTWDLLLIDNACVATTEILN